MQENAYLALADDAFRAIGDALDAVDSELVDCESAGDVITLTFAGGRKCIVNTQRPTRQIWLAANARAWHFSWDDATRRWLDDKGGGDELFATLTRIVRDGAGLEISFG
jgi:CyaY protein